MEYIGTADLYERWAVYTPRGIRKLALSEDFPRPAFTINGGKIKVWRLIDIEGYEADRPELFSQILKKRKVRSFHFGNLMKRSGQ